MYTFSLRQQSDGLWVTIMYKDGIKVSEAGAFRSSTRAKVEGDLWIEQSNKDKL